MAAGWQVLLRFCFYLFLSGQNIAAADKFVGSLIVIWFIDPNLSLPQAEDALLTGDHHRQEDEEDDWCMVVVFSSSGDAREVVSLTSELIARPEWVHNIFNSLHRQYIHQRVDKWAGKQN